MRPYTRWTHRRKVLLDELMAQGVSDEAASQRLGTTPIAIREACRRFGIARPFRQGYTLSRLEATLGYGQRALQRWEAEGRIRMLRGIASIAGQQCLITRDVHLMEFLENPDHWHVWEWERIRDDSLREYCRRLRSHVVYLTATEAALMIDVTPEAVTKMIRTGRLPAKRDGVEHRILHDDIEALLKARAA